MGRSANGGPVPLHACYGRARLGQEDAVHRAIRLNVLLISGGLLVLSLACGTPPPAEESPAAEAPAEETPAAEAPAEEATLEAEADENK